MVPVVGVWWVVGKVWEKLDMVGLSLGDGIERSSRAEVISRLPELRMEMGRRLSLRDSGGARDDDD
jgi:hypothetical protein